jgi:hypothetical protein
VADDPINAMDPTGEETSPPSPQESTIDYFESKAVAKISSAINFCKSALSFQYDPNQPSIQLITLLLNEEQTLAKAVADYYAQILHNIGEKYGNKGNQIFNSNNPGPPPPQPPPSQ